MKVVLNIISIVFAVIGFPMTLVLVFLEMINAEITTTFYWTIALSLCVLSIAAFSIGRLLVLWDESGNNK